MLRIYLQKRWWEQYINTLTLSVVEIDFLILEQ